MKNILFSTLLILVFGLGNAQTFELNLELPTAANKKLSLVSYYNSQFVITDTLILDDNGSGAITKDTVMHTGLYKLYVNGKTHFDFLLGEDQTLSIKNENFTIDKTIVEGAIETVEFAKYMVFLRNMQKERKALSDSAKTATEDQKKEINNTLRGLTTKLHDYWKDIDEKYPNTFLANFLMANYTTPLDETTIPEEIRANDSALLRYKFDYQKEHYFDHFDLLEEGLFYTPLMKPKFETYYTKVILQTFDSLYVASIDLLEKIKPNKPLFQYVCSYILNKSINSKIMGMDALFVEIANRYYISGEAFWATEKTLEKIKENLLFSEKNLIGMTAPELQLESIDGEQYFSLHQIDKEYTLIVIYEPNCEHCKVFVPELYKDVYEKYKDKSFEIFAIYSMDKKEEWVEFIDKYELHDWINVWDEHHQSRFKITYDARKTPGVYLLDKDKKIIAKKLSVKQVEKYLKDRLD